MEGCPKTAQALSFSFIKPTYGGWGGGGEGGGEGGEVGKYIYANLNVGQV